MNSKKADEKELNKDLDGLLKNMSLALKTYSIKELKEALFKILNKNHDPKTEIDFVIANVCQAYLVTKRVLIQTNARGMKGEVQQARITVYAILHFDLGMPVRAIARQVFNRYHNTITHGLKMFRQMEPEKFKTDKEFMEKYIAIREKVANQITKA